MNKPNASGKPGPNEPGSRVGAFFWGTLGIIMYAAYLWVRSSGPVQDYLDPYTR
jgi:hypothetical protein